MEIQMFVNFVMQKDKYYYELLNLLGIWHGNHNAHNIFNGRTNTEDELSESAHSYNDDDDVVRCSAL